MKRHRFLLFGLTAVLALTVAGGWLLWSRRPAITPENAGNIREGMTLAEVEAILGGPPRNEGQSRWTVEGPQPLQWVTDDLVVFVYFSRDGCSDPEGRGHVSSHRLLYVGFDRGGVRLSNDGPLDRLLGMLGRWLRL